jgi:hypothetical protein
MSSENTNPINSVTDTLPQAIERRTFLGGLTAASFGVLLENAFAEPARAPKASKAGVSGQDSFEASEIKVPGNTIFVRRYGQGPGILMVHGFPRTSLMWRFLAPKLADAHTVICVDLPAYGRSGTPASTDDHFPYSKRAMGNQLVEAMSQLGFPTFTLIGHDRGGRVSYRHTGHGSCWRRRIRCRRAICWARQKPYFITPSGKALSAGAFSTSTSQPIAIRFVFMVSARSIEPRHPSMSSMIVPTKKRAKRSIVPCCISGPRVDRSIRFMKRMEDH